METEKSGGMITAQNVDLGNCDKEQIQFCGAIQPHGVLIAVDEPSWTVAQISANADERLGITPESAVGQPVERVLGREQTRRLRNAVATQRTLICPPVCLLTTPPAGRTQEWHVFVHRNDEGQLILELEPAAPDGPVSLQELYTEVRASIAELQRTESLQAFFDLAVSRIRRFTGYDRVLAYKFLDDSSGWVLAEDREEGLDSYVGLHYPATDIPEPARRLFSKKWVSHLPDVSYEPVPLIAAKRPEKPLDLSYSLMRSVSVMYSGYLKNMGVQSTMVLTLLKNGKLWGLISCMHHRGPKHVAYPTRVTAEVLAHLMSLTMASKEELEDREYVSEMKTVQAKLVESMLQHVNFQEGLLRHQPNLLSYFGATGAAVFVDGHVHRLGDAPEEDRLRDLFEWLSLTMGQDQFATDRLPSLYPPAAAYQAHAAGLLALRLFMHKPHFIVWFRPEVERTVDWAGDPRKPVDVSQINGVAQLMPRTSFALWKESVKGVSKPWRDSELVAAADLRRAIVDVVLRKAEELARANEELTRSNVELDAFAYIASHDLKEPLRGVHNYARFVLEDYGDKLDEEGKGKLKTMMKLTERMDELIDGLLHYSRLGREELESEPTDLLALVKRVAQSLTPRFQELGVAVRLPDSLPPVSVNPVMLQEVFANLMTNAMKYNDKPEKWIEVGSAAPDRAPESIRRKLRDGDVILYVKDNGIGIPKKHFDTIFQIFRRLHARDQYGGGTGVGLTIAKKILERHGGYMWVDSEPGRGSTFFLSLPAQR
ncbi:ATP-binding protein [Nitrospira moscoviensis]|uniref:histidine kinase n=1 Tax=Nitrospira moscoviensis TaxID=42253 RepID=A0A0K2GER4_NITMO|nr:ATP-binding protein [Nitrospira moscoviensis]ALA59107.1 putative Cyanobacterial phytochrome B [Nitrospira moscoviensis]